MLLNTVAGENGKKVAIQFDNSVLMAKEQTKDQYNRKKRPKLVNINVTNRAARQYYRGKNKILL